MVTEDRRTAPPPPGVSGGVRRSVVRRPAGSEALLVCVLLAGYAAVLLANLSVPQPSDQIFYMGAARTFPSRGHNPLIEHQYMRIGLTGPTAAVMKVFGYSEVTYHALPVASALLLFGSVYAIGRMLFGRLVGVLSACLLAGIGIIVVAGTELLPDLPATAMFTAAVAVLIALRRRLLVRRRRWLAVAGVLLGWSYLTREFIVFVWPLAIALLWRRAGRWEWLWLAAPVALTGVGEMALNSARYGDPLARMHAASGLGDLPSTPDVAATFRDLPLWVYLWRLPRELARLPEGPALVLLLALTLAAGSVLAVRWLLAVRRGAGSAGPARWIAMFAGWILLLWVPLTLLGGVLDPARPRLRIQLLRYWYPVFPAFALGGVAVLWLLARPLGRVPRGMVVSAVVLAILGLAALGRPGLPGLPGRPGWAGSPRVSSDALPEFRSWLANSGARTVWADSRLFRILPLYFVTPTGHRIWHGHLEPMATAAQPAPGDYVVVYGAGGNACSRCAQAAKAAIPSIPPTWRPVLTSQDRLLRVWRVVPE